MKIPRARKGPFPERLHFREGEIERMCVEELSATGLLPAAPGPVRIDRFIERRFKISPRYEALPNGVLGYTKFGPCGVEEVIIADHLDVDTATPIRRRLRSTLAHEAGHGLLHAKLFALSSKPAPLFAGGSAPEILCRDVQGEPLRAGYNGRWWEYQANRAIGGLLLPTPLLERACEPYLKVQGSFGMKSLPPDQRQNAARAVADLFDVNPVVGRIRLDALFPALDGSQALL